MGISVNNSASINIGSSVGNINSVNIGVSFSETVA